MSNNVKTVDLSDLATLLDGYKKLSKSHADLRAELAENARLRAELAAERERVEAATHYATQITVWTVETFFEPDKTGWKPLTELLGVLSQLDNALVGVREKRDKLREALVKARGLVSGAFVNRRLDHDVAIFQHSAVMEAIAAIAAVLAETGGEDE